MILIKFGRQEHLQLLKEGLVHFNPLSLFRQDGTAFRGDKLEGTYVIDTSKGFFVDGIDIAKLGSGFRATQTYVGSDDVLIFCAAVLDRSNSIIESANKINIEDSFIFEMRKFGQYAVIFDGELFASRVTDALSQFHCNLAYHGIEYCNKTDHAGMRMKIKELEPTFGESTIYFIKDKDYQTQHEWRYIIDYFPDKSKLNPNQSFDLRIEPFEMSDIIDIDKMIHIE